MTNSLYDFGNNILDQGYTQPDSSLAFGGGSSGLFNNSSDSYLNAILSGNSGNSGNISGLSDFMQNANGYLDFGSKALGLIDDLSLFGKRRAIANSNLSTAKLDRAALQQKMDQRAANISAMAQMSNPMYG